MSSFPLAEPDVAAEGDLRMAGRGEWRTVRRHRLPLRLMHWINLLCMIVLVGSGLQIFNAHPALYWGPVSTFDRPALAMTAAPGADGKARGITTLGNARFDTTGVLGVSRRADGMRVKRGFPEWATIPGPRSLALGRRWHFFFAWLWVANGELYLLCRSAGTCCATLADAAGVARHPRLDPRPPAAAPPDRRSSYALQRAAESRVPRRHLRLLPLIVLTGLAMSPRMDACPAAGSAALVGGRQSARIDPLRRGVGAAAVRAVHLFDVLVVAYAGPLTKCAR